MSDKRNVQGFGPKQRALLERAKRENWPTGRLLVALRQVRREGSDVQTSREQR